VAGHRGRVCRRPEGDVDDDARWWAATALPPLQAPASHLPAAAAPAGEDDPAAALCTHGPRPPLTSGAADDDVIVKLVLDAPEAERP